MLCGDEAELFREHAGWLERCTAQAIAAERELIADACMRTWMIFLEQQPRRESVRGWLRVVAYREALGLLRRQRRFEPSQMIEDTPGPTLDHIVQQRARAREGLEALAALPARRRQAL